MTDVIKKSQLRDATGEVKKLHREPLGVVRAAQPAAGGNADSPALQRRIFQAVPENKNFVPGSLAGNSNDYIIWERLR
jgi:hypothetical protein